ncbi:hypothetical protein VPHD479_0179 [Vibrio phage D479]
MSLSPCKVCGCAPFVHQSPVSAVGCTFYAHIVECTFEEEYNGKQVPPFVEHTLSVYGATKEEAEQRWEELNGEVGV